MGTRQEVQSSRAHDVFCLALAQLRRYGCWTVDERLHNPVRRRLTWGKWLGRFDTQEAA